MQSKCREVQFKTQGFVSGFVQSPSRGLSAIYTVCVWTRKSRLKQDTFSVDKTTDAFKRRLQRASLSH